MIRRNTLLAALLISGLTYGQEVRSVEQQLADLELTLDSLSLFSFLDSIINSPSAKSEMGVRFGYSNTRLIAGRDFNTKQKGYSPGVSYYHKSGIYLDWVSFLDNQSNTALNQSILHGGYMWAPNRRWLINPYLEKTFNHRDVTYDLNQSIGSSVTYDFSIAEATIDYSFLWGKETGHRFIASLNKTIEFKKVPVINRVKICPSVSIIAGTTDIFNYQYSTQEIDDYLLKIQYLTDDEIRSLRVSGEITTAEAIELRRYRWLLNQGNADNRDYLIGLLNTIENDNIFAVLSYNFSLPMSFDIGSKTTVLLSYSYSVPIELPGEDLAISPTPFFSFSLNRRITW